MMRSKEEILTDFRRIAQGLYSGETPHDLAGMLQGLVDEFSSLGLSSNVINTIEGHAVNTLQIGQIGDPYQGLREAISYLKGNQVSPEQFRSFAPYLDAQVNLLSQMGEGGSVTNTIRGTATNAIQTGNVYGGIHFP